MAKKENIIKVIVEGKQTLQSDERIFFQPLLAGIDRDR